MASKLYWESPENNLNQCGRKWLAILSVTKNPWNKTTNCVQNCTSIQIFIIYISLLLKISFVWAHQMPKCLNIIKQLPRISILILSSIITCPNSPQMTLGFRKSIHWKELERIWSKHIVRITREGNGHQMIKTPFSHLLCKIAFWYKVFERF